MLRQKKKVLKITHPPSLKSDSKTDVPLQARGSRSKNETNSFALSLSCSLSLWGPSTGKQLGAVSLACHSPPLCKSDTGLTSRPNLSLQPYLKEAASREDSALIMPAFQPEERDGASCPTDLASSTGYKGRV